jgi:hypothetical protein
MAPHPEQSPRKLPPSALDPEMLTSLVRRIVTRETVDAVEIVEQPKQQVIEGGTTGTIVRLSGTGRDQSTLIPWSVILKFVPAPGDGTTKFAQTNDDSTQYNYWRRELFVYTSDLLSDLPDGFAVPRCFHRDEQPDGYWLWLEDIQDIFARQWPISH